MSTDASDRSSASTLGYLLQDWVANKGNAKGRLVCFLFRGAQLLRGPGDRPPVVSVPLLIAYRVVVEWILGIELPWGAKIGKNLRIFHGVGLVVNDGSVLGENVTLRHGVTLGHKDSRGPCPRVGSRVEFGPGAVVIGDVSIGDDAVIAPSAVVVRDVRPGDVVGGNPARSLRG